MTDYKTMYFNLSGALATAIEALDKLSEQLKAAQIKMEDIYIGAKEPFEGEIQ